MVALLRWRASLPLRRSLALLFALIAFTSAPVLAQDKAAGSESRIDWRADLQTLVQQLRLRHPDPFHDVSEAQFTSRAAALEQRIAGLSDWEAAIELQRLLASLREGHTGLAYLQPEFGARGYPIRFQAFDDGIFVQAVPASHERLLGARLLGIGDVPIDEAARRISGTLSADNRAGERRQLPFMLSVNIVLHALNISGDRNEATYLLKRADGVTERVTLSSLPVEEVGSMLEPGMEPPQSENWRRLRDGAGAPEPLWLGRTADLYWHEYLPEQRTLYAQINRLYDRGKFNFDTFTKSLFAAYDQHRPQRLVIDLRHNSGGDHIDLPFIYELIRRPELTQRGRLFVLIGSSTFSAAQTFVNHLEEHANAIFVGEETAQRPNMYGVSGRFSLPSSGLRVSHSRYYIQGVDPADFRVATAPQIAVTYTSDDYAQNRDPALAAALRFKPVQLPNLLDELAAAYEAGGVTAALATYKRLLPDFSSQGVSTEPLLGRFASGLLRRGKSDDAVQILRLNAEAHPRSSSAHDALAEGLLSADRASEAAAAAKAALALNPANTDARRVLELAMLRPRAISSD